MLLDVQLWRCFCWHTAANHCSRKWGKKVRGRGYRVFAISAWLVYTVDTLLFSAAAITVGVSHNNGLQSDNSTSVCVCLCVCEMLVTIIHSSPPPRGVVCSALPVILLQSRGPIGSLISVNGSSHNKLCDRPRCIPVTSVFGAHSECTMRLRPTVVAAHLMKPHRSRKVWTFSVSWLRNILFLSLP